jgi:hypothetical protein
MQDAAFVLHGTIEAVGESLVAGIAPSDRTINLRVDEVLEAPADARPAAGQAVTVEMAKKVTQKPGDRLTVFANAVTFAATLGLVEVASDAGEPEALAGQLGDARIGAHQAAMQERLESADMVVAGKVVELTAVESDSPRLSEHAPTWWEATIQVDEMIKGSGRTKTVKMRYPTSADVMWRDVPQPRAGQTGVFILRKGVAPDLPKAALTALDPLDIQGPEERPMVAKMLGKS